jgi:hypothetical protein
MTCRNAKDDVETGGASSVRDEFGSSPGGCPSGIRHIGGAKPNQALVWNVGTCRPNVKGAVQTITMGRRTPATRSPLEETEFEHSVALHHRG